MKQINIVIYSVLLFCVQNQIFPTLCVWWYFLLFLSSPINWLRQMVTLPKPGSVNWEAFFLSTVASCSVCVWVPLLFYVHFVTPGSATPAPVDVNWLGDKLKIHQNKHSELIIDVILLMFIISIITLRSNKMTRYSSTVLPFTYFKNKYMRSFIGNS